MCDLSILRCSHWLPTITAPPGFTDTGECGLDEGLSGSTGAVFSNAAVSGPSNELGTGDCEGLCI